MTRQKNSTRRRLRRCGWATRLATFSAALLVSAAMGAQGPADLVSYLAGPVAPSPAAVASQEVVIRTDLLAGAAVSFRIELPDGPVAIAQLDGFEARSPEDVVWRGRLLFEPASRVVLTLHGGVVAGRIVAPYGLYEVRPLAGGRQVFEKLDPALFPECEGGVATEGESSARVWRAGDPADQVEVMSLYTPQARAGAGGQAQIEATIQAAVDNANTAFIDSDMVGRLVLVHTAEAARNDSGNLSSDLGWLQSDAGVAALRDLHAADMVSLIVNNGGGCGIGYVMRNPGSAFESSAFQVTVRSCAVGNLTYAHEHGHNLGFEHDPANGISPGNASYPWSFAHFTAGSYRTVMSYSNQCNPCPRVAHFSNPDVLHSGQATGIADQRDNARTGDLTAPIAANFRVAPLTLTVTKEGAGGGTVTSSPAGISCGGACSEDFDSGTEVALAAVPAADSSFAGWGGDSDCADGLVTLTEDTACTATFDLLPAYSLNISIAGSGSGSVASWPAGIDCGVDCDETYVETTAVQLTGTPATGSEFTSWTGDADCTDGQVTMLAARSCTATFDTCSGQSEVVFENATVNTLQVVPACNKLELGPMVGVVNGGVLEAHAGNEVIFRDGLTVEDSGELAVWVGQPLP